MTHITKKQAAPGFSGKGCARAGEIFPLTHWLLLLALLLGGERAGAAAPAFLTFTNAVLLGGNGNDDARAVVASADGAVFVAGSFAQSLATAAGTLTSAGSLDGYLLRVSPAGAVDWAVRFGGTGTDQAESLTLDAEGNLCVGGFFAGTATFPGANQLQAQAGNDGFYASFATNGTIRWVRQIAGSGEEFVRGVAAIPGGGVKVLGQYTQTATWNQNALASNGVVTMLIGAVDGDGFPIPSTIVRAGSDLGIAPNRLAVASDGSAVVTGLFQGTALGRTSGAGGDLFVAKFSAAGALTWVFNGGGPNLLYAKALALSADDSVTVGVAFQGTVVFNGKSFAAPTMGSWLGRIDFAGVLTSSNFVDNAQVTAIATGKRGVVQVAANYTGTVTVAGETFTAANGNGETFLASYLPDGQLGGISRIASGANAVVLDAVAGADDGMLLAGYGGQGVTVDGTGGGTAAGLESNLLLVRLTRPEYRVAAGLTGSLLHLSYPAYYFDATLQTNALLPGAWGDAPATVIAQPGLRRIDFEMAAPERYYRLKRTAN